MAQTVLLIDYDPISIARIRNLLGSRGFEILLARDGASGVEEFHRSRPALTLIQDLVPKLHGFDACRKIKDSNEGKKRPVVILSSRANHARLVDTGCDAYLEKPFPDDALLELVSVVLSRVSPAPSTEAEGEHGEDDPFATVACLPVGLTENELDLRLDSVLSCAAAAPKTKG